MVGSFTKPPFLVLVLMVDFMLTKEEEEGRLIHFAVVMLQLMCLMSKIKVQGPLDLRMPSLNEVHLRRPKVVNQLKRSRTFHIISRIF